MNPPADPPPAINRAASDGFGRAAGDYERARPSYPPDAIDFLVRTLAIGAGTRTVDLAAGTGKLTRLLVPTGADLLAVEPVAAMRAELARVLPDLEVLDGTAEAIPLPDASVDVVTVAQAFHWFAPAAVPEIARVLRPGGRLGLVWNVRDESVDWVRRFTEITLARSGGTPYRRDYSFARWAEAFAGHEDFTALSSRRFRFEQDADIDLVVQRAASISFVAAMDEGDRAATLDEVREMLVTHPALQGPERFSFPYETDVYWCHRRG